MYQCLKHYIQHHTPEEYVDTCVGLMKAFSTIDESEKHKILFDIAVASGRTDTLAYVSGVKELPDQKRIYCKNLKAQLDGEGIHCDCGDCRHLGENIHKIEGGRRSYRLYDPTLDADIVRWCLLDQSYLVSLRQETWLKAMRGRGLLETPVYLLQLPEYSYSVRVYAVIFDVLQDAGIYFTLGDLSEQDADTIRRNVLDRFPEIDETYRDRVENTFFALFRSLLDKNILADRNDLDERMEPYRPLTGSSLLNSAKMSTAARVSLQNEKRAALPFDSTSEPMPNMLANLLEPPVETEPPVSEQTDEVVRDTEQGTEQIEEQTKKQFNQQSETHIEESREESFTSLNDDVILVYDLPSDAIIIEEISGLPKTEGHVPCEVAKSRDGELFLVMWVDDKLYAIPELLFDYITDLHPLSFFPFAILSLFPNIRNIQSVGLAWHSYYIRRYAPGPLRVIYELLQETGEGLSFQLSRYPAAYRAILSQISADVSKYKELLYEAIFRSPCFLMQNLVEDGQLFHYDNGYVMEHHSLHAMCGHVIVHITIPALSREGLFEVMRGMSEEYAKHSYFKSKTFYFLGMVEGNREYRFLIDRAEREEFFEFVHIIVMKLALPFINGVAEVHISEGG